MSTPASTKSIVKVSILGDEYSIRSETTPEQTRAVAEYVDKTIRQIMNSGNVVETHKAAILAALSITGELFEARESAYTVAGLMDKLSDEVKPWLPPAKRG